METDHSPEIGTLARELQHHRAAEAKPDRRDPAGIDLHQVRQRRERGAAAGAEFFRLGAQAADQGCDLLQIAGLPPVAEHVGGQRNIADVCKPPCALHCKLAESHALVKHQHARARCRCVVVPGEIAPQIDILAAVIEIARRHEVLFNIS